MAMTESEIYAALEDIFHQVLENPSIKLGPQTTADDVEGWDSMNHVFIAVEIERRFNIKLQAAEMEELKNVGEMVAAIQKKQA